MDAATAEHILPDAPPPAPDGLERLAVHAAMAAGRVLLGRFGAPAQAVRAKSGPADLVSQADLDAEALILRLLKRHRPADGVRGEEGASRPSASGLTWIVDPLDGTANFLADVPHWAVSIACEDAFGELVGAVHDPIRGETFRAARGHGAHRGELRLAGPPRRDLREATITGDFAAPSTAERARSAELAAALFPAVGHVRSLGSAALDLAWVACGRADAFYHERWFKPWDVAAGVVLCREAGLEVDELAPLGPGLSPRLLAARPHLMETLRALVA
jgi:myo-inositol-1(or 4)-monophosphatase